MGTAADTRLQLVRDDLTRIFGDRLEAFVAYGSAGDTAASMALVRSLGTDDLAACASRSAAWQRAGASTPLLLTRAEFTRALDAFPVEFGEIIATHTVLAGANPFDGLAIRPDDLRRACEVQARSLLLHLREDYIECGGRPADVASLVTESAAAFAALLRNLDRFGAGDPPIDARVVGDLHALASGKGSGVDASKLFPDYVTAVEQLVGYINQWVGR